jgi:hypothetical protein
MPVPVDSRSIESLTMALYRSASLDELVDRYARHRDAEAFGERA